MLLDEAGREVIVLSESGERDFFFSRENAGFFTSWPKLCILAQSMHFLELLAKNHTFWQRSDRKIHIFGCFAFRFLMRFAILFAMRLPKVSQNVWAYRFRFSFSSCFFMGL